MLTLSYSEAKDFRACPRLHHYKYELLYRPATEPEATRFGSLWHRGLEAWYRAIQSREDESAWSLIAIDAMRASLPTPDPLDLVRAEELLRGYHCRWAEEKLIVLAVEAEFTCPLINPGTHAASRTWQLGGKLDAVVRDACGHTLLMEHKTTSDDIGAESDYWRRLTLDPQVSTYFVGARALGYDPEGCLYNVVAKPRLRPATIPLVDENGVKIVHDASGARVRTRDAKKWRETGDAVAGYALQTREETLDEYRARLRSDIAANPHRYYQRGDVVRLADQEEEAAFDMWATGRLIREAQLAKRHVRNPDACVRWRRLCPYFPVCCGEASLDDPALFRRAERPHEELTRESEIK